MKQEAALQGVRLLVHPAQYCLHRLAVAVQDFRLWSLPTLPGRGKGGGPGMQGTGLGIFYMQNVGCPAKQQLF